MSWEDLKRDLEEVKHYNVHIDMELKKIETDMFETIYSLLRVVNEENSNDYNNIMQGNTSEEDIENLKNGYISKAQNISKLSENSENYYIPEMLLYVMSHAHNNWVSNNINKYGLKNDNTAYKYVPFNMLNWNVVEKEYYSILKPIIDSIGIKCDKEEICKQFQRNQLTFLFENEVFSKEDLHDRMKNIINTYKTIYLDVNKADDEKYSDDAVIENISNQVSKKMELNWAKRFKQVLMMDKGEIGIITASNIQQRKKVYKFSDNIGQKIIGFKKDAFPVFNKPISKVLYNLATVNGIIFAKNIKKHEYKYFNSNIIMNRPVQFISYEDCSEEQKRQISKRRKKVKKFVDKVEKYAKNKKEEYGLITLIPINKENPNELPGSNYKKTNNESGNIIQIRMSLKELAQFEILPEEIGWESHNKALITSSKGKLLDAGDYVSRLNNEIANDFIDRVKVNISEGDKTKKINMDKDNKEDREI